MARILAVGIATLDIVNVVPSYPAEDSEVRALAQRIARGGNAANTLVVLSQLGHRCSWAGVLAEDDDLPRILADLAAYAIDVRHCRREPHGKNPTSYILLSQANGSRSIVHYRDLREFGLADLEGVDLAGFDWVHFEGRAVEETARMLTHVRRLRPDMPVSLEVEKQRAQIERLFAYPDVLFFSRDFAAGRGFADPRGFLNANRQLAPQAHLVCAWGSEGAVALANTGAWFSSPAFPPQTAVDTLGAGDTFNAAVIDALVRGRTLRQAVTAGCRLAGRKCGRVGFSGLVADA